MLMMPNSSGIEPMGTERDQPLMVSGGLTIRDVNAVHLQMVTLLADQDRLVVDLSGLIEIDLAGIQLLISARKTALAAGKMISLHIPADSPISALLLRGGFIQPGSQPVWGPDGFWHATREAAL